VYTHRLKAAHTPDDTVPAAPPRRGPPACAACRRPCSFTGFYSAQQPAASGTRPAAQPASTRASKSLVPNGHPFLFESSWVSQNDLLHLKLSTGPRRDSTVTQGCGSGSGLDPYSIGLVDPDPDPYSEFGSGSGSRRAKMTNKSRKKFVKVHVLKCWMASFSSITWTYFMEA
jgi:hypothetical protein